jgi:hypothetical protein
LPFFDIFKHCLHWFNLGSAAQYGKDNFLTFDLVVPEGCELHHPTDKRVFYEGAKVENFRRVDLGGKYSEMVHANNGAVARSR